MLVLVAQGDPNGVVKKRSAQVELSAGAAIRLKWARRLPAEEEGIERSGGVAPLLLDSFELVPLSEVPSPPLIRRGAEDQEEAEDGSAPSPKQVIAAAALLADLTGLHHPECKGLVITVPMVSNTGEIDDDNPCFIAGG